MHLIRTVEQLYVTTKMLI